MQAPATTPRSVVALFAFALAAVCFFVVLNGDSAPRDRSNAQVSTATQLLGLSDLFRSAPPPPPAPTPPAVTQPGKTDPVDAAMDKLTDQVVDYMLEGVVGASASDVHAISSYVYATLEHIFSAGTSPSTPATRKAAWSRGEPGLALGLQTQYDVSTFLSTYSILLMIINNGRAYLWNSVWGLPTSSAVQIPLCDAIPDLVMIPQGSTGISTPYVDPTMLPTAAGQCPPNKEQQAGADRAAEYNAGYGKSHMDTNVFTRIGTVEDGSKDVNLTSQAKWSEVAQRTIADTNDALQNNAFGVDTAMPTGPNPNAPTWDWIGGVENAYNYTMKVLGSGSSMIFSPYRVLTPDYLYENAADGFTPLPSTSGTPGHYTAEATELECFQGSGQHLMQGVSSSDPNANGASYALKLEIAGALELRPEFAGSKYGGDAYFSAEKKLTHIYKDGVTYTADSPQWENIQNQFRGTLNVVGTAINHLFYDHLVVANGLAIGTLKSLPKDHHLRRLNTKFTFRSTSINRLAASMLVPQYSILQRGSMLTAKGVDQLWQVGKKMIPRRLTPPEMKAARNLGNLDLPFWKEGLGWYDVLHKYVTDYFTAAGYDLSATEDACAADPDLVTYWKNWDEAIPDFTIANGAPLTCTALIDALASAYWDLSGFHNYIGTVDSENVDPCFAPWGWKTADTNHCTPPNNWFTQVMVYVLTGLYQPRIVESYEHLMMTDATKQVEADFVAAVAHFSDNAPQRPDFIAFTPSQSDMTAANIIPSNPQFQARYNQRHFGIETTISI